MTDDFMNLPLDEEFDTMMDVQQNPHGAWQAIQTLTDQIEGLKKELNICRMAQVVMENGIAQVEGEFARAMKHVMDYSNDPHLVQFARTTLAEIEGDRE